jgi:hypothetical protein
MQLSLTHIERTFLPVSQTQPKDTAAKKGDEYGGNRIRVSSATPQLPSKTSDGQFPLG